MIQVHFNRFSRHLGRWRKAGTAICIGGALLISGCSTMEDVGEATADGISTAANAMNPFNWFDDEDDKKKAQEEKPKETATASGQVAQNNPEKYPKLNTVPDRPRRPTSSKAKRERESLRDGLVADSENAHYSDRELRAQQAAPPRRPWPRRRLDPRIRPARMSGFRRQRPKQRPLHRRRSPPRRSRPGRPRPHGFRRRRPRNRGNRRRWLRARQRRKPRHNPLRSCRRPRRPSPASRRHNQTPLARAGPWRRKYRRARRRRPLRAHRRPLRRAGSSRRSRSQRSISPMVRRA